MSTFSHSQDEERGKQPAREAPGEQGEVPRKRDDSKDDKSDPASAGWPIASPCLTNDTKTRGTWGQRLQRRSFGITHYTFVRHHYRRNQMAIHKKGLAHWEGDLKHGKGTVSTESGALSQQPYGFNTRFEGVKGTNPEELIGAAHAACFSMALSLMLSEEGYTATSIDTTAVVTLNKTDGGFAITDIALQSQIVLPDVSPAAFDEIIQKAKAGCPVSQVLKANITLDYQLNP